MKKKTKYFLRITFLKVETFVILPFYVILDFKQIYEIL